MNAKEAYRIAKAAYDAAFAEYQRRTAAEMEDLTDDATEEEVHRVVLKDAGIAAACNLDKTRADFFEAERALLAWGLEHLRQTPGYKANDADIEFMFANVYRLPSQKQKVVDLTLRLAI